MGGIEIELSHKLFSEKLGSVLDMSDSIALSEAHGRLARMRHEPSDEPAESIVEMFVQARSAMVQGVVRSFSGDTSIPGIRLPSQLSTQLSVRENPGTEDERTFSPYHRFYVAHQREFEYKVRTVHGQVRDLISGLSPELGRLAALDQVLGSTFLARTRKFLTVIPVILGRRFEVLTLSAEQTRQTEQTEDSRGEWLEQFCHEMKMLLLAELEFRLLPTLGLIESIEPDAQKMRRDRQM
jgi:hypothetical protein